MKDRLIYALKCPFTKEIHYIGKSTSGMIRPSAHFKNSHSNKIKEWVEELSNLGQKPEISVLTYVSEQSDIDEIENLYITKYVNKGCKLLNSIKIKPVTILPISEEKDPYGMKSIGAFIKSRRKLVGLTQKDFANRCGVGLRFIREIEGNKKNNFNTETVNQVLAMFGHKLSIEKI